MKKLLSLLLIVVLSLNVLPKTGFAAPSETDLQEFLLEIELTKEELVEYLVQYELTLDDFENVSDLEAFLGAVLTEENLQELLLEYDLTLVQAEALLIEYGDLEEGQTVFDVFHFYDDLDWLLYVYSDPSFEPITDENLEELLLSYNLTYDELVSYLELQGGYLIEDFWGINELYDFLGPLLTEEGLEELLVMYDITLEELEALLVEYGEIEEGQSVLDAYKFYNELDWTIYNYLEFENYTPINEENLQELLDRYALTYDELVALFEENGDSVDYYTYIEELDAMTDYYLYATDFDEMLSEIGLTEDELMNLFDHLMTLDVEDPAFEAKLLELSDRLDAIESFETVDEISAEELAEIASVFTELLQLFQLDVQYYLVNGDEKTPLNLQALMAMTELVGSDLLIEIYNHEGFLADLFITGEKFNSNLIEDVSDDLKEVEKVVEAAPKPVVKKDEKSAQKPVVKTVKGGKLPNTASDYPVKTLAGLVIVAFGFFLFRRWKKNYAA
ncbi:processed acidic surface protein [Litchfieldia alkalitelluris]|uniref:processed acidic surface protein n=1 Tax=Litchfieldia alkalitelluris TaxID=304268 RepID=UPI00099892D4|nr:processed acidic surface protein [Litchfieldia alkalitelluris]